MSNPDDSSPLAPHQDITPAELARRIQDGTAPALVDVREPHEWSIGHLPTARLIPLGSLATAAASLQPDTELVVYCHHGSRSDAAAQWLRVQGFANVRNLVGGIDRWSLDVDPAVRRY